MDTKNRIYYVGIAGYGYMGNFHCNRVKETDGLELRAVFDIDRTKTEKIDHEAHKDIIIYQDMESLCMDEKIDLVIICTPNDSHAQLAVKALAHGKHVLCEKPAAMSLEELDLIIHTAEENDRMFTVHQNRRWDKDYQTVRKVLESGLIGQPVTVISQTFGQRGVCFGWRADPKKGGGMLYDWGIHLIDQLLILFPDSKIISVYARLRSILTPAVDDYFEAELEFDNEIVAHISVGTFALQDLPRWFIFGDKGTLRLEDFTGTSGGLSKIKEGVREFKRVTKNQALGPSRTMAHLEKENLEDLPLPVAEGENKFYENLVAALRNEKSDIVTYREMRRDMQVLEAVFESSAKAQRILTDI